MLEKIKICKIVKFCCIVCIFYIVWFQYVFSENHIILYGSVIGAIVFMILDIIVTKGDFRDICPVGLLINLVMCVYSLATGMWVAKNTELLIRTVKTYTTFSFICIAICYVTKNEGSIDWIANTLISVSILTAFCVIFNGYPYKGYGYVLGPAQNPNYLGVLMDVSLFGLAYKTHKNKKRIPLYLGTAVVFVFVIVNSGSRKTLLGAAIIMGLWMLPLFRRLWSGAGWGKRILLIAGALIAIAGVVYYFTSVYSTTDSFQRMQRLGTEGELSSRKRKLYYQFALEYFAEHPFFGIGLNQFGRWNPDHQMAHSTYAEAFADWGTVGCLIYFTPVIIAFISLIRIIIREKDDTYIPRIVLGLFAMELFLGVGQAWFFEIEHMIAWTLLYYLIDDMIQKPQNKKTRMECKYVKA